MSIFWSAQIAIFLMTTTAFMKGSIHKKSVLASGYGEGSPLTQPYVFITIPILN